MRFKIEGSYTRGQSAGPWVIEAGSLEAARRGAESLGILVTSVSLIPEGLVVPKVPRIVLPREAGFRGLALFTAQFLAVLGCAAVLIGTIAQMVWAVFHFQSSGLGVVVALGVGVVGVFSFLFCAALAIVFDQVSWLGPLVRQQQEEINQLRSLITELRQNGSN